MFLSRGRTGARIAAVLGNVQPLVTVVIAALLRSATTAGSQLPPGPPWDAVVVESTGGRP